jgi:hypothetical protein
MPLAFSTRAGMNAWYPRHEWTAAVAACCFAAVPGVLMRSWVTCRYARCIPCPLYMVTPDSVTGIAPSSGYTDQGACVTRPGWGVDVDTYAAEKCPLGSYNQGLNRMPCVECPSSFTTLTEASVNITDCVVKPGW